MFLQTGLTIVKPKTEYQPREGIVEEGGNELRRSVNFDPLQPATATLPVVSV
jgi:hypothetical protein